MDGDRTFHLDRMHVDGAGNGIQGSEVLCCCREVHISRSLTVGQSTPMWKPSTGEPCAGEPHARFGGRGRREPSPTPIKMAFACLLERNSLCETGATGVLQPRLQLGLVIGKPADAVSQSFTGHGVTVHGPGEFGPVAVHALLWRHALRD